MEHETSYLFKPTATDVEGPRLAKKRKIDAPAGLHASWPRRRVLYDRVWAKQASDFDFVFEESDRATVKDVSDFITDASTVGDPIQIDSSILMTGPALASQSKLTRRIHQSLKEKTRACLVSFKSNEVSNLKGVLKRVNAVGSLAELPDDDDGDEQQVASRRGTRLLNYDLRILENAVKDHSWEKIIVAFEDCEAFDGSLLSEVIELFSCWKDRIPFVLIFRVATSVEALQAKLSKRAIRCVKGRRFDVAAASTTLERLFLSMHNDHIHSDDKKLWLGSTISRSIMARHNDYLQNISSVADSVQYAYMTHFYANALSIFLDDHLNPQDIPADHFEALRNLPSFMDHARSLLDQEDRKPALVKQLLESDAELLKHVKRHVKEGQQRVRNIASAAYLYSWLAECIDGLEQPSVSDLIIQALSGSMLGSARLKTFFLSLKRVRSDTLLKLIEAGGIVENRVLRQDIEDSKEKLARLTKGMKEGDAPLRSEVDIQSSTLRTTVVAKKVELSKAKTTLTAADTAYSKILNGFIKNIQDYFTDNFIDPKSLPFHEIFLFDLKSPHRNVFTPRPRFAIERALSLPHDYLNCDCCGQANGDEDDSATLSSTQPATAVLFQLYLESGALVNAADLRSAFAAIMGDEIENEAELSALFQRSLAELSYLGLVKGTKKKADHVLKLAWRGL